MRSVISRRLGPAAALAALAAVVLALAQAAAGAGIATGVLDVETNLAYQDGSAAGTGMALTPSGEVLTNNHVIRGATKISVVDPSTGRRYAATVVGYSVTRDIAVLRLKGASQLDTVTLGNSATVKVGHSVTAVGNAGGAGGTPSSATGKVTGLKKTIVASDGEGLAERLVGLIRTDATLQPGDSGGPLLNTSGKVIGINTAASAGFYFRDAAEGFAIPINSALAIVKQIEARHASATVHIGSTPFLGVSVAPDRYRSGALVVSVLSGSPAERAGLAAGDTIVALDGKSVASYAQLSALLLRHNAGATVTIRWVDSTGSTHTASVKTVAGPPQ